MLLNRNTSCCLLIDVQEKLTPLVLRSEVMVERCAWVMQLARALDVPVMISEHYTKGLGHTVAVLKSLVSDSPKIDKVHFSCYQDPLFHKEWQAIDKKQAVLLGIETHVCVLQTALDLHEAGVEVFVVADAVSSRKELDHHAALKRMAHLGIQLVTSEMVFFEWLKQAGTLEFKTLSKQFIR
ncbi:MAG: hydrolase [Legionellaceae bacterium]